MRCWRRCLRVPWTARRSNQSILKISPGISLEGLILKLKLQYFGLLMWRTNWLTGKDPDAGKDWRQEEKGMTENETVGWHHWLDGHELEQAPGDGEGQGSLACCSPWGHKEMGMIDWLNNNNLVVKNIFISCWFSCCLLLAYLLLSVTETKGIINTITVHFTHKVRKIYNKHSPQY